MSRKQNTLLTVLAPNSLTRIAARLACLVAATLIALCATSTASDLSFEEVAQSTDLAFLGTVAEQSCGSLPVGGMMYTRVRFADVETLHASEESLQQHQGEIDLVYAGGSDGRRSVTVSGTPSFDDGERYLVLMLDDGNRYTNPAISNQLGVFRLVEDPASGMLYPLSYGGKAILSVSPGHLELSRRRVEVIEDGMIIPAEDPWRDEWILDGVAESFDPDGSAEPSADLALPETEGPALSLEELVNYLFEVALVEPVEEPVLRFGDPEDKTRGRRAAHDLHDAEQQVASLETAELVETSEWARPSRLHAYDSELSACGYHDLSLTMEQVSTSNWTWGANNFNMVIWNDVMDVFRYTADDGKFGDYNGENEFVGFASDSLFHSVYGFHYNGAWGMTINYVDGDNYCNEIEESDILFNAAYSWTDDINVHLATPTKHLYRTACIHETGHAWGLMSGYAKETYAYDHPSVMNSPNSSIVEDGKGVHVPDVWLMRRQYSDQTSVLQNIDVGVESYYASNGLRTSTPDRWTYNPNESMTIKNVTVENLSASAVADVRLRFYLSADRTITTADHQLGSYWFGWPSFPAEKYNVANYTVTVPPNVTPGKYYVGALVTSNGFGSDVNDTNDATSLRARVTILSRPPSNVQASDGAFQNKIRVTWDPAPGATGYLVYRSTSASGTPTLYASTTATTYDDTSVGTGYYWYQVKTMCGFGASTFSDADTGYTGVMTVTSVSATDGSFTDKVRVTWGQAGGATSYEVWRATQNSLSAATRIGTPTSTTYDDVTAVPEIMYYYWVRAVSGTSTGGFSPSDYGWRHLAFPTAVAATDGAYPDKVRVTWNSVPYAASYQVYRNTVFNASTATKIASGIVANQYDDTTATPGVTYYYWLQAVNAFGASSYSFHDTGSASPEGDDG